MHWRLSELCLLGRIDEYPRDPMRCSGRSGGRLLARYPRDPGARVPTFSLGSYAQDQGPRGKVVDYRISIEIGQVRIEPGDIIFGDLDGICVVPRRAETEVFQAAIEKGRGEKTVRAALESGMSAVEAFRTYGIL